MRFFTVVVFLLLCEISFAQNGYNIIESNPVWVSENYQSQELQPWGSITNAGAAFEANSDFAPNPTNNSGDYRFDYQITSHVVVPGFQGEVTYLVNSADNSVAIPFDRNNNAGLRNLLLSRHPDYGNLHFLIRKANRNILVCGLYKNQKTGILEKRGLDLGKDVPMNEVLGENIWSQQYWFNDAQPPLTSEQVGETGASPYLLQILENVPIEGFRGKAPGNQTIDLYFVKFPLSERITPEFMGLGNGIIKNLKNRTNQLVVWMAARNVPWKGGTTDLFFYLQKLYKANAVFHPGNYKVMTMFNKEGMQDARSFQQYAMQKYQKIKEIQNQAKNCPEGDAGKACRERYEKQIKQIQKELEDKAKQLGQKHHVPIQ